MAHCTNWQEKEMLMESRWILDDLDDDDGEYEDDDGDDGES